MHFHFHEKCRFVGISNEGSKCSNKGDQICEEDAQGISIGFLQLYLHKRYTAYLHSTRNVLSCGFQRLLAACKSPGTFSLPLFYFKAVSPSQKKWLKKTKKSRKKTQVIYTSIQILSSRSLSFFFLVLRKPQKILPSFCVHMNGKVKQSSEKSKKAKNKTPSFLSMAEDSHRILVDLISKCSPAYSRGW